MMRLPTAATLAFTLTSILVAQGPGGGRPPGGPGPVVRTNTITTATDFGALATLGATSAFQATATGTAVTTPVRAVAQAGTRFQGARATSRVAFARSREGDGVSITEEGLVRNADATIGASAGTSSSAPGSTSPTAGAHGVSVNWPALASGTNAIVSIHWRGRASTGASVSASVDVHGDGTTDFTGNAGAATTQLLQVTAGATGVTVAISTNGSATLAAAGAESWFGDIAVFVMAGTLPTSCTFTNFGAACGADLNGTVATGLDLSLDVTNAPANALGFFMAGDQSTTPSPLPQGVCNLLIDGRRFFHGHYFRTDATGAASVGVPTPRTALTVSFQAVLLSVDPTTNARTMVATNGTELVCQ